MFIKKQRLNIYIYIYIYNLRDKFFTQLCLNEILSRNNMTRSKCQNRELAIATVVNRNDLYHTWRGKNGQFMQGRWWQRAIYCTVQTSKTSAFQSLWEFQTMTKDLWNVNSKSTNLNHTLTVIFCFLPYKLMADIFHSTTVCFIKSFGLCSKLPQDLGSYSLCL